MGGRAVVSDDEDELEEVDDEGNMQGAGKGDIEERDEDDDEEDEEEGQDEYEKDGFIVDDVEEEEEGEENNEDSDEERHRKKRKKKRESERTYVLDEDDYELLEDNNITVHRPKPGSKFKRLKKAGRDSEAEERSGFSDDEESERADRGGRTAEEKLKRSLFGDDEGAPLEDIAEEEEQPEEEEGDLIGDEDEMADFIVDEEDVDENGTIVRRPKVKKKKSKQAPGVSSSALQEAQEIFGDVDELLMLRKQGMARDSSEWVEKRLEDEFEPFILSEKYMTPKDDAIRETDVPERIQLLEDLTGPPPTDDKSIEEESAWIYNQLSSSFVSPLFGHDQLVKDIDKEDIGRVLTMVHVQKLDIPFIAMYRKEFCRSLLKDSDDMIQNTEENSPIKWHKVLWAVHSLDRKWLLLQKRKSALEMYYSKRFEEEARRIDDETRLALNRQIFSSISEALKEAKSEREADDVDAKFNLHFPPGEVDVEEGQFKRPKRKSLYSICYKAGLWEVANKFGFNSEQFGLHLSLEKMRLEELQDGKEVPEEVARNFTCAMFEAAQDVLKGARHMAAVEIGCEPVVRKHVRSIFMENAVVSTSPTTDGNSTIDAYHQLAGVKWLRDKPLSKFIDAQWLLIQKAEQEKLLQVTIKLPESVQSKLLVDASECYLSECVSKPAQLWNEQRKMILEDSFHNFILPSMEKEARSLLMARAKNWLLMEYGKQLWNKVSVGPYQRKGNSVDIENEDEPELRVMTCCWGPGKPANTFVMLDSAGEVVDIIYAGSISIKSQGVAEQQRKKGDQDRLLRFMTEHQPHVVCLGAANLSCRQLKDDIYEVIFKIVEDHPRDVSQDMNITIVWGDESLPRLFENARVSSDQLPGQPGIVKRAVALGRYLQNPLAMVATLCGPGKEILSWKLCPLDDFLTPDEKYDMVEQIMVDATNQIGVDVNLASSHEWLFAPLQFVAGLGPRKASSLQRAFVRSGSIFNRKEIPVGKIIRKKVFINAVGFLRVRRSGAAAATSHIIDLLDDTRIHPESYDLAKTMAKDVYSEDAPDDINDMDDDVLEMAIEHVREKSDMLKVLVIEEYAKSIAERFGTDKKETLEDIKNELLHGFKDWRHPFTEPNPDEEFSMLSGESDDSLSEGRIVEVSVRYVQDSRVVCFFDSGLKGFIYAEDFSDEGFEPEKVKEGDILTCKIKSVVKSRCLVNLICKESEMRKRHYIPQNLDPFYQEDDVTLHSEQEKARKEKELAKKRFKPRMISHPRFQNVTADEAMAFLANKDSGESIIRPSSKGPSYLTLTLKISNGVYAHKDIIESGKDHKDITSLLRIGKTLTIDKDTFEDLDEVMDRYVDPLVTNLKNVLSYRKFRRGTKLEVDDQLRKEKAENPMRIVYSFGISHDHPGTFVLSYIRSSNPHHEYVGLYPKCFRFRKKDFEDLDRLVAYFQKNIDKPPLESGPSIQTVAAKVPMKSPAWGYSSDGVFGGSTGSNDGWSSQTPDRERTSTPGSRGGRSDYRGRGGRDGHPSGLPRPGRGRGRSYGRGNNFESGGRGSDYGNSKWGSNSDHGNSKWGSNSDHGNSKWGSNSNDDHGNSKWGSNSNDDHDNSKWGSNSNDDDGLSSFPGAKVQDSPGKERFPGGWDATGRGGGGWGGSNNAAEDREDGGFGGRGWGNSRGDSAGGGWGGGDAGFGSNTGGGWGGNSTGGGGGGRGGNSAGDGGDGRGADSSGWGSSKKLVPQGGGGGGWSGGGGGSRSGGGWD
ncbi:transcription elongation factor SPT6 homolog isoform X1 [Dendrobium catenatum]|uniref:transcription elongation factor SPT6 homolog isoform X1 n=1 Tax=Dendrobium catenatum TaxID=906689 RepID=UPI0009F6D341|nr:transcription elongation factor SPT6 homolog isoform X1 [Dendrobium catenatum]